MKTLKTSKVDSCKEMGQPDQNGNHSYLLKLANGDEGFFRTPKEPPIIGSEFEYEIESLPTKNDPNKFYNKITRPGQLGNFSKGEGRPAELPKHRIIGFAASYVKDCIVAGKIEVDNFEKYFELWFNIMKSKI